MVSIAVIGSSSPNEPETLQRIARELGDRLGQHYKADLTVLTGACLGFPDETARAARTHGAKTIGFSGARNEAQHLEEAKGKARYVHPATLDEIVYLKNKRDDAPSFTLRSVDMVQRADAVIALGGNLGTMTELGMALEERDAIPVYLVSNTDGITDKFEQLGLQFTRSGPLLHRSVDEIMQDITQRFPRQTHVRSQRSARTRRIYQPAAYAVSIAAALALAAVPHSNSSERHVWYNVPSIGGDNVHAIIPAGCAHPAIVFIGPEITRDPRAGGAVMSRVVVTSSTCSAADVHVEDKMPVSKAYRDNATALAQAMLGTGAR